MAEIRHLSSELNEKSLICVMRTIARRVIFGQVR
jgi:hypothetical protein